MTGYSAMSGDGTWEGRGGRCHRQGLRDQDSLSDGAEAGGGINSAPLPAAFDAGSKRREELFRLLHPIVISNRF